MCIGFRAVIGLPGALWRLLCVLTELLHLLPAAWEGDYNCEPLLSPSLLQLVTTQVLWVWL